VGLIDEPACMRVTKHSYDISLGDLFFAIYISMNFLLGSFSFLLLTTSSIFIDTSNRQTTHIQRSIKMTTNVFIGPENGGNAISNHYDGRAERYDTHTTFHAMLAKEYVGFVEPREGERVLDLACGTGMVGYQCEFWFLILILILISISFCVLEHWWWKGGFEGG
jgi:hypothetical protein